MSAQATIRRFAALFVVLAGGTSVPVAGWTHWEGFEAADPSTPAALLRFQSAASGYTQEDSDRESWLARLEIVARPDEPGPVSTTERSAGHSDHAPVAQPTPAPTPQ